MRDCFEAEFEAEEIKESGLEEREVDDGEDTIVPNPAAPGPAAEVEVGIPNDAVLFAALDTTDDPSFSFSFFTFFSRFTVDEALDDEEKLLFLAFSLTFSATFLARSRIRRSSPRLRASGSRGISSIPSRAFSRPTTAETS